MIKNILRVYLSFVIFFLTPTGGYSEMKKAYYYASRTVKFVEVKKEDGSLWFKKNVSGKAEARLVAKESNAVAWNF